jgi:SPP1 family holin
MSNNGTTLRVSFFILTWINTFLASKGLYHIEHIDEQEVSILLAAAASVWTLYKNNNFTKASKIAQNKLDTLKENKVK